MPSQDPGQDHADRDDIDGRDDEQDGDHFGSLPRVNQARGAASRNPLAGEVLELIRNGDVTGQSFSGRFVQSQRSRGRTGDLDTIVRSEIALREVGPTPSPAYKEATILGVRAGEGEDDDSWLTPSARRRRLYYLRKMTA